MSVPASTRVLVVDEHEIVRTGLRAVLSDLPEFNLAGEALDAPTAVQAASDLSPGLVIMDLASSGSSAVDAVSKIKQRRPVTKVSIFSGSRSKSHVASILRAGADAYVLKEAAIPELIAAMHLVLEGHTYVSPQVAEYAVGASFVDPEPGGATVPAPHLSQRERQVLRLVSTGQTSKQIAKELFISPRTVEKHRARLMRKLKLNSLAALMVFAISNGYLNEASASWAGAVGRHELARVDDVGLRDMAACLGRLAAGTLQRSRAETRRSLWT